MQIFPLQNNWTAQEPEEPEEIEDSVSIQIKMLLSPNCLLFKKLLRLTKIDRRWYQGERK